jgi:hypothetical protein
MGKKRRESHVVRDDRKVQGSPERSAEEMAELKKDIHESIDEIFKNAGNEEPLILISAIAGHSGKKGFSIGHEVCLAVGRGSALLAANYHNSRNLINKILEEDAPISHHLELYKGVAVGVEAQDLGLDLGDIAEQMNKKKPAKKKAAVKKKTTKKKVAKKKKK